MAKCEIICYNIVIKKISITFSTILKIKKFIFKKDPSPPKADRDEMKKLCQKSKNVNSFLWLVEC